MKNKIISSKQIKKTNADWHLEQLHDMLKAAGTHESTLQVAPIAISKSFIDATGNIVPVTFAPVSSEGQINLSPEVASLFPNLVTQSTSLLEAGGKRSAIPSGRRYAVLFSGGPAPGGHNVVAGIKKALGTNNTLLGVVKGPGGLLRGDLFELSDELVESFLNKGGFNELQTDRTKIKTDEQFQKVLDVINKNDLDGIIIIGGDDSNTNAAVLAERAIVWQQRGLLKKPCQIIGVPKTIDGDLKFGSLLPISFGFHTATRIYAEIVANIQRDAHATDKIWHFIKLMGRSASHVTLEVALKTHPQVALIGEEVQAKNLTLDDIGLMIAKIIVQRSARHMDHGVALLPEGLIEFIPEVNALLNSISKILLDNKEVDALPLEKQIEFVKEKLTATEVKLLNSFPPIVIASLFDEKDPHGNLQVSKIPTETLIISITKQKLMDMKG